MDADTPISEPIAPPTWLPPAAGDPRRSGRFRSIAALVVVVAVVGVGLGAFLLWPRSDRTYPDHWDPRLEKLVAFVEEERGLDFEHPVFADFLTDRDFEQRMKVNHDDLTAEERRQLKNDTALLRAVGLIDGDVDLLEAFNQVDAETTLAYYDPDRKRIVVRGTRLDAATRVTLVHELTHALQDQHFPLHLDDDGLAYRGLVEGDATRIEDRYIATLTASEARAYEKSQSEFGDQVDLGDVPEVFVTMQGAPYALGPGLVTALLADGGQQRLDEAFRKPPENDADLFEPLTFVAGDEPTLLPAPSLAPDETRLEGDEDDSFGAIGWFVVLSERIDPHQALDAVDGLGGDVGIAFERDGRVCGRLAFSGVSDRDTDEMATALDAWVKKMPDGDATVERGGGGVTFTSCDPGIEAKASTGRAADAFTLPALRSFVYRELVDSSGLSSDEAWCGADAVVGDLTLAEMLDPKAEALTSDEGQQRIGELIGGCVRA